MQNDILLCTFGKCEKPQTEDGEYCDKHYPKLNLTKKEVQEWLNETVSEDWKTYRNILKNEKGYKTKKEFMLDSYNFGCDDPYDNLNWSAGYISALSKVLEKLK